MRTHDNNARWSGVTRSDSTSHLENDFFLKMMRMLAIFALGALFASVHAGNGLGESCRPHKFNVTSINETAVRVSSVNHCYKTIISPFDRPYNFVAAVFRRLVLG